MQRIFLLLTFPGTWSRLQWPSKGFLPFSGEAFEAHRAKLLLANTSNGARSAPKASRPNQPTSFVCIQTLFSEMWPPSQRHTINPQTSVPHLEFKPLPMSVAKGSVSSPFYNRVNIEQLLAPKKWLLSDPSPYHHCWSKQYSLQRLHSIKHASSTKWRLGS